MAAVSNRDPGLQACRRPADCVSGSACTVVAARPPAPDASPSRVEATDPAFRPDITAWTRQLGHRLVSDREQCLGMDAYLTKPIHAATLRQTLEQVLGDRPAA